MGPPQPSLQLDSDTLEQINSQLASSRPPTAFHDAQTLDQLLPPKRDLPFLKPAAKKPRTSRKQTNKTSVENGSTGMIAAITRQAVLLTKHETTDMGQTQPSVQAPPPHPKQNKAPSQTTRTTDSNEGLSYSLTPLPQLNMNTDQEIPANAPNSPPTQQNTQTNTNTPYRLTLPQAAIQQEASMPTPLVIQQTSKKDPSCATITTNSISNIASAQQPQQQQSNIIPDLTSYISAPTTERIARLENWICEHIQDDDFLRLCQDVEGVWKRVAFGN